MMKQYMMTFLAKPEKKWTDSTLTLALRPFHKPSLQLLVLESVEKRCTFCPHHHLPPSVYLCSFPSVFDSFFLCNAHFYLPFISSESLECLKISVKFPARTKEVGGLLELFKQCR